MPNIRQRLIESAAEIFEDSPVLFAYLYGSYATGETHPFSDLDIGIYIAELDIRKSLKLELSLSLKVDEMMGSKIQSEVRVLNHLPLTVLGKVLGEGVLLHSTDESRRIEFETRVRMAYFDFLPVIRRYRQAYRQTVNEV